MCRHECKSAWDYTSPFKAMCAGMNVSLPVTIPCVMTTLPRKSLFGGLAQLARAPALQAGGQRFESVILHMTSDCSWCEHEK